MKIDTHQHFWRYNERDYGWMGPGMEALKRDYLPAELAKLLSKTGIDGTVAVQARQCPEESDFLLGLADEYPFIKAVVGWVDLCSERVDDQLERFCRRPRFRGVRHVIHDEPDDRFMMREDFRRGIGKLKNYGLVYELLLFARHLALAAEFVAQFPEQMFVLDHIGKPAIRDGRLRPWANDIRKLARFDNVACKISGMVTEADWESWKPKQLVPYMETVLEAFGHERVMIGSDWPVCTVAATYEEVMETAYDFVGRLSASEQEAIWAGNAQRIYAIET